MEVILFFSIFLNFKSVIYGCLQNPQSCDRPLIEIGDMFECPPCPPTPCTLTIGTYFELVNPTTTMSADCCCTYTATATCEPIPPVPAGGKNKNQMQLNGNGINIITYPLTFTCDTTTNQYTYDNAGTPTYVTSAKCCFLSCQDINKLGTQLDNTYAPDAACTYNRFLTCLNGSPTMTINNPIPAGPGTGPGFPGPEAGIPSPHFTQCPAGAPVWIHNSPMYGPNTPLGKARC